MNREINNNSIINLALFLGAFFLIYTISYPLYNGKGLNLLGESNILFELAKKTELNKYYNMALEFKSTGDMQSVAYNNLDPIQKDRINIALPQKLDMGRLVNDISTIAKNSKVDLSDINFSKSVNNSDTSNINTYVVTFTIKSDYGSFRDFIKIIENNLQLLNINSFTITLDNSENKSYNTYSYNITLQTYELK